MGGHTPQTPYGGSTPQTPEHLQGNSVSLAPPCVQDQERTHGGPPTQWTSLTAGAGHGGRFWQALAASCGRGLCPFTLSAKSKDASGFSPPAGVQERACQKSGHTLALLPCLFLGRAALFLAPSYLRRLRRKRSNQMQNPHTPKPVYFGGSRSLQSPSPAVNQVVMAVCQSGASIHVGCCVGADALIISSALLGYKSNLIVFAISDPQGQGSFPLSSSLPQAAAGLGVSVHWQAGGPIQVPLSARLIKRSMAAAAGCGAAVFFSPGSGSLAVAARLVSSMPVFAFGDQPAPIPGQAGQWVPSRYLYFTCWQWSSAQQSLF